MHHALPLECNEHYTACGESHDTCLLLSLYNLNLHARFNLCQIQNLSLHHFQVLLQLLCRVYHIRRIFGLATNLLLLNFKVLYNIRHAFCKMQIACSFLVSVTEKVLVLTLPSSPNNGHLWQNNLEFSCMHPFSSAQIT